MITHLQNEADVIRSSAWRRRRRVQELAARPTPHVSGPVTVRPTFQATGTLMRRLPTKKSLPTGLAPIPQNGSIILKLVERIASGTDPLRDLAIVNIVTRLGEKPSGPKTVMFVGDLADRIADGSIRLDQGDPYRRRRTRGWMAPLFFAAIRRILMDKRK